MKAYVLHDINNFCFEEADVPEPEENEVLIATKAVGICGSDIPRVYKTGTYSYPLIPGHEFSGFVVAVGRNVDSCWLNKRVGVFPLIPCGRCASCVKEEYETCRGYSYLGSRADGGFAEYVKVPVWNLLELTGETSYEQAAMLEPMAVAVHAMRKINLCKEDFSAGNGGGKIEADGTIAICGLGTIGLLLLMFLIEQGYSNILAIGNKLFQKKMAIEMGLPEKDFCDVRMNDVGLWISERTGQEGVNNFFECVGRNDTLVQAINYTAPGGNICLVGNPASDMTLDRNTYWKLLRNQLTVCGTWNSSFKHSDMDDWAYVLNKLKEGKICPERLITHKFSLDELYKGFEIMRDKHEDYVKIMGIADE